MKIEIVSGIVIDGAEPAHGHCGAGELFYRRPGHALKTAAPDGGRDAARPRGCARRHAWWFAPACACAITGMPKRAAAAA